MSYKASLEQLREIAEKRDKVHSDFIKHVLLMASGLLGIIVSLHKTGSLGVFARISFSGAVCSLALGIILLTISLSIHLTVQRSIFLKWKAEISLQLADENYKPKPVYTNPSKAFLFCEKAGFISLFFAVVCLAFYAVIIS